MDTYDTIDARDPLGAPALDEIVGSSPSRVEGLRPGHASLEVRAAGTQVEPPGAGERGPEELEEQRVVERQLQGILEALPCGLVVRDADGGIVDANGNAQRMLGQSLEALLRAGSHPALQAERADGRLRHVAGSDGQRRVLASHYAPLRRRDGAIVGSVELLDDQTHRACMEERLRAADELASLGTMAAGIAHEIRNPLNAINGFAQLLLRRPNQDEESRRWCRLIVEAGAEADRIIESMLSLGSAEKLRLEAVEPNELVESAVRLALPETHDASDLAFEVTVDAPPFLADRVKIRQALRNLVANAVKAQADQDESCVHVWITLDEEDLLVRVADAGPGVAPEVGQLVFDPFYTNHPDGTGLGLALVSTIVHLHGGSVRVSPEPSPLGGAEFVLRIPFQPAPPPPESPTPPTEG